MFLIHGRFAVHVCLVVVLLKPAVRVVALALGVFRIGKYHMLVCLYKVVAVSVGLIVLLGSCCYYMQVCSAFLGLQVF